MYIKRKLFAGLSVLGVALAMSIAFLNGGSKAIKTFSYSNTTPEDYYSDISETAVGDTLLASLQSLNTSKRKSLVGYDSMPNKFQLTDPGTSSGQVTSFYSGTSARYSGNMNREHTWPASRTVGGRGSDPLEDDIHMTRPTLTSDNSSRGNSFFTYTTERGWDPASLGVESYRGDSARIILYCVVADSRLSLVDRDIDSSSNHTMGKLSTLLEWNLMYPVASREQTRNTEAEKLQGNRNPFIDHPEYACRIWGNYNSNTKNVCGSTPVPPDPGPGEMTSLNLDVHEKTLAVGESFTLNAIIEPSSLSSSVVLDWFSSDDKIATVSSNGLVKGLKNGKVEITVCTTDMAFMDACVVTVGSGKSPSSSSGSGCSGNIASTSIILSTLSLVGVSVLIYHKINKRKKNNV